HDHFVAILGDPIAYSFPEDAQLVLLNLVQKNRWFLEKNVFSAFSYFETITQLKSVLKWRSFSEEEYGLLYEFIVCTYLSSLSKEDYIANLSSMLPDEMVRV